VNIKVTLTGPDVIDKLIDSIYDTTVGLYLSVSLSLLHVIKRRLSEAAPLRMRWLQDGHVHVGGLSHLRA